MAFVQQDQGFSPWVQMRAMREQNMTPAIHGQMAAQAGPFEVEALNAALRPDQAAPFTPMSQAQAMSLPPPPPEVKSPPPQTVPLTAQRTTQPLGTLPQEIVPVQDALLPQKQSLHGLMDAARASYGQSLALTQKEINKLKDRLAQYQKSPLGVNFAPLAALLDRYFGGNLTQVALATAPESPEEREKNIAEMQRRIAEAQGRLSGDELQGSRMLLEQLGYEEKRKHDIELEKLRAAHARELEAMRAGEREKEQERYFQEREAARRERQAIDYGRHVMKQAAFLDENFKNLESALGFKVSDIDPKSGLVKGKRVDIPGISVRGFGRVEITEDAADLKTRFAPIFNITLRDRSGATITNRELENLKQEFGQGRFNTEEKMLAAVRRFRDATIALLKAEETGYSKETREFYKESGGKTLDDMFDQRIKASDKIVVDGWTPEKEQRLQELRKKLGK